MVVIIQDTPRVAHVGGDVPGGESAVRSLDTSDLRWGTGMDLTGCTAVIVVRRAGAELHRLPMVIEAPASAGVVCWANRPTLAPGDYRVEVIVTAPGARTTTVPTRGSHRLSVLPGGGS